MVLTDFPWLFNVKSWKTREKVSIYSNNLTGTYSPLYKTAFFKTHTVMEFDASGNPHQVVMLENKHDGKVVAINKDEDNVIAKVRHITSVIKVSD